jgi:hypothetical protein
LSEKSLVLMRGGRDFFLNLNVQETAISESSVRRLSLAAVVEYYVEQG